MIAALKIVTTLSAAVALTLAGCVYGTGGFLACFVFIVVAAKVTVFRT